MSGRCRSCQAQVIWAVTTAGNPIPLDPEQDPDGLITLDKIPGHRKPVATVWSKGNRPPADTPTYTTHFATCPNAGRHRKERSSGRTPAGH